MKIKSKSVCGSITALAAGLVLVLGQSNARADWDNWDDGDDLSPPIAWTHVDPIFSISGDYATQNTYDASTGQYHLIAPQGSSLLGLGQARTLALAPNVYSDFYISVDLVDWDNDTVQAIALAARVSDVGPGTTDGYGFGLAAGGTLLTGQNYVRILRLENESTKDVHGSGPVGTCEMLIPDLIPGHKYRLIFMGRGTELEGRFYDLSNLTTPLAVVQGDTAGDTIQLSSGTCGVLAFGATAGLGADVTFDNYYASSRVPLTITDMVVRDDFNNGNDTSPISWTHYDPIYLASQALGLGLGPQDTWSFPGGNKYRLQALPSPDAGQLGPGRVGSIGDPSTIRTTDFRVAVDVVNLDWTNPNLDMAIGFLARVHDPGPGMTKAHALTFQSRPNYRDIDLIRVSNESPDESAGGENLRVDGGDDTKPIDWSTNTMRLVFVGQGNTLRGLVYKMPETMNPLVDCVAVDTNTPAYTAGPTALFGFDNSGGGSLEVDVTFDNYSDTPIAAPAVSVTIGAAPTAEVTITWPAVNEGVWVLESSPTIGPGAVWTKVMTTTGSEPAGKIIFDPATGKNTYMGTTPMSTTANTFFRLKKV